MDSHEKRIAVLIDADNVSAEYISFIFDEVSNHGAPTYKRIYGDFTQPRLGKWKQVLLNYSIIPIQQYSYTRGKNSTDSALIIDAMDILYSRNIDGFCIVSSDSDFTRLASRLREAGMTVIGMGERKTPAPFVNACEQFKYLEVLAASSGKQEQDSEEEDIKEEKQPARTPQHKSDSPTPARATISRAIASIIDDVADADGWAPLGSVGQRLNTRYPAFDSRNYGYKKLSLFVDSFKRFEVQNRTLPNQHEAQTFIRYTEPKSARARSRSADSRRYEETAEKTRPPHKILPGLTDPSLNEFLEAAAVLEAELAAQTDSIVGTTSELDLVTGTSPGTENEPPKKKRRGRLRKDEGKAAAANLTYGEFMTSRERPEETSPEPGSAVHTAGPAAAETGAPGEKASAGYPGDSRMAVSEREGSGSSKQTTSVPEEAGSLLQDILPSLQHGEGEKSAPGTAEPDENKEGEASSVQTAGKPAPKRSRASKKKAQPEIDSEESASVLSEAESVASSEDAADKDTMEEKPKRRTRSRKAAENSQETAVKEAAETSPESPPEASEDKKPAKRTRASRAAAAAQGPDSEPAPAPKRSARTKAKSEAAAAVEEATKKAARRRTKKTAESGTDNLPS